MFSALMCLLCREWRTSLHNWNFISALFKAIAFVLFIKQQPMIASQTEKQKERERERQRVRADTPGIRFLKTKLN
jgi:hypothetical protein